jgi:hypothetical protein
VSGGTRSAEVDGDIYHPAEQREARLGDDHDHRRRKPTGTIENDDIQVRISGATISEGTGGTKNLDFAITLTQVSDQPVTVTFKLKKARAKEGSDYNLPEFMTAVIPCGSDVRDHLNPIVTDSISEQNETFTVELTDATNAKVGVSTATGTIVNDDAAPSLSIESVTSSEGNSGTKDFVFKVKLSAASGQKCEWLQLQPQARRQRVPISSPMQRL